MASAPSRNEVEQLHRLMMQASADASRLDQRLNDEQKGDSLSAELRHWREAADDLSGAVDRARTGLLRDGTSRQLVDRVRDRLQALGESSRRFDVESDLDGCVRHWRSLGVELAQLVGEHRDDLVRLLASKKSRIDQTTSVLSSARKTAGMLPEKHKRVRGLQDQRDDARAKYERLRQQYLAAERGYQLADLEKAQAREHREKKAPLPGFAGTARRGPVLVRLPDPKQGDPAARPKLPPPPPTLRSSFRAPSLTQAQQPRQHAQRPASGPARIALERIERVAGYPEGVDGIGRGGQSAALFFRAENLPESLSVQGTTSIQLGCATRLEVMPSVQLFSAVAGAPLKGKLSLLVISSGGRLGTSSPGSALEAAKGAARAGGRQVAGKLGVIGKQLESAIADLLEDAADKIFRRAQSRATQNLLPARLASRGKAAEHQVARVNHALGGILQSAHAVKGAPAATQRLLQRLDRDHHHRDSVAGRLEQTLSHLATATHRTLTDPVGGELRSHLARMDAILSRLRGKAGPEVASGAQEISEILQRMGGIAAGKGGAPHVSVLRKLIDERRGQLHTLSADSRRKSGAEAIRTRGALQQMPSSQVLGEKQLAALRRQHPGLDQLLKNASHAQLASELGKLERTALGSLAGKNRQPRQSGLGGGSLTGAFQALGVATLHQAPQGTPLNELARTAERRQKQLATKHSGKRGPAASQITAAALLEVFKEHPKGRTFASHLAPGGSLRTLCETAQRGHGLPVGQMAQHFLAARGHSNVFNAVATFNNLTKSGNQPRRRGLGSLGHFVSSQVSSAISSVSRTVNNAGSFASATPHAVRGGMSSFASNAKSFGGEAVGGVRNVVQRGAGAARSFASGAGTIGSSISSRGHGLWNTARQSTQDAWGGMKQSGGRAWGQTRQGGHALSSVARGGFNALPAGAGWVQHQAGATRDAARQRAGVAVDWARQRASGTSHWLGGTVHSGLEWTGKIGVVGGIGQGLKRGFSSIKKASGSTPLGLAVQAGKWAGGGGLAKVWDQSKGVAGKALGGIKSAYQATSNFLQSPGGQLLVTGLSLAASFIPGGILVKAIVGGGIGAIQAISEGKDWKGILAGTAGGALAGALPFLKIGALAKVGTGALTGGIASLAQGGSLKDALKGAAGGAVDSFDPGAFKALSRLKGVSAAGKLLKGKNLSKAEKALVEGSKFAGPLRGLEKAMANPKTARMVSGLEKAGSKTVRGGLWVSGKAAKAQGVLDKVAGAGDKVHGVLAQVHDLAPGLADVLGDNAAGQFVGKAGDWAGQGDEKLSKALEYGHGASDQLTKYRGYLDKGLGFAGVKDPAKAYEKMMARRDLAAGKKGGLERVAALKLEAHQRPSRGGRATAARTMRRERGGLEKASELARAGAKILGDESELGRYLLEVSTKADRAHDYLEQGIGSAEESSQEAGKAHDLASTSPLQQATHLEGDRKAVHDGTPSHPDLFENTRTIFAIRTKVPAFGEGLKDRDAAGEVRKKALKAGKKVDGSLGKMERALGKGIRIGRTVDGGLAKISGVADQLAKALGEDSELGHFAHQVSGASGAGHEKLHDALNLAGKGKRGLGKGRAIFEQGLKLAQGHHEEKLAQVHGKKSGHLKAGDWKSAFGDGKNQPADPEPQPGPQPGTAQGGGGFGEADISVVQGAMQWVTSFGKAVSAALKDIEKLMSDGKTREAGDRVLAVSMTSEQARLEVTRAVSTSAKYPALQKQAQSASKNYLEIRKHFFNFVKGLHGLGGQTTGLEGVDGKKVPDLLALSTDIHDLQVKVDGLGQLKHADTPMQGPVGELKKEASGLRARVSQAQSAHKEDAAAAEVVAGLSDKLQQIERHLGAHADRKNSAQGDKDLGIAGAPRPKDPRSQPPRRGKTDGDDPIGDVLDGDHGRISVDRGAARGGTDARDGQDVDAAAADTWIGSGEGVKLFSEVFGAFLPAEGALVAHQAGGGGGLQANGFFKGLFDHLEGFADKVGGWAKLGGQMLGKGMDFAEMGMHGLSSIEEAAGEVQGLAGKAEGFLGKMGLGELAGFAGEIGGAAGWVDQESKLLHGGLGTADKWMGQGKKIASQVDSAAGEAGGLFEEAEHGRFGSLLNLFKASRDGDGIDGRLVPEKMRLGSQFDEPRRLDVMTLSRMEGFLGGDFAGVRIHTGPGAAQVTNRFAAEAVTVKDHIFFAPGRFNPATAEGQRLLAHELTHVMQKGRPNLDVRTAESEALHAEHSFSYGNPQMETLNLSQPAPDFRLGDGEGLGNASGVHTARRNRSRGHEVGGKDTLPDGDEFMELVSNRVYELLMDELEHAFESR